MIVKTYAELSKLVKTLPKLGFIVLVSKGGLGKTSVVEETLPLSSIINTHITTLSFYERLYKLRDKDICIEDVDKVINKEGMSKILKNVCDTKQNKEVQWNSTTSLLEARDIPDKFVTTSRLIITLNEVKANNQNVKAIIDRAIKIVFSPTKEEIIKKIMTFKDVDKALVRDLRKSGVQPTLRMYVKLKRLKDAGHVGLKKKYLSSLSSFASWYEDAIVLHDTDTERFISFKKKYKKSKSSYERYKKQVVR